MEILEEMESTASLILTRNLFGIIKENDTQLIAPCLELISKESKKRLFNNYCNCLAEGFEEPYAYNEFLIDIFMSVLNLNFLKIHNSPILTVA